ncbi:hypothetical protein [Streptomyces sp. NPDC058695]
MNKAATHELGIQPAYDPKFNVEFTPLRQQDLTAAAEEGDEDEYEWGR